VKGGSDYFRQKISKWGMSGTGVHEKKGGIIRNWDEDLTAI